MEDTELRKVLETLFFITDHPLAPERVGQLCDIKDKARINEAILALKNSLDESQSALQLMQISGGWQMATRPENSIWVRKLYNNKMTVRLSQAAIETLCIIAYRQPMTRAEVEAVRGVEVIGPLDTLTERKLVTVVGRRETVGRPILYGTTREFLRQFGLNSLDDLPKLENMPAPSSALVPPPEPAQPVLFDGLAADTADTGAGVEGVAEESADDVLKADEAALNESFIPSETEQAADAEIDKPEVLTEVEELPKEALLTRPFDDAVSVSDAPEPVASASEESEELK